MNYRTGWTHYMGHLKKNAPPFPEFRRHLLEVNYVRRPVLVIDNASYHRTRAIPDLPEEHADHALVLRPPRYSPELNLIEGLWGYLKRSALNNYFFGTVGSLERAIHAAFENLHQHPKTALALAYRFDAKLRRTA